MLSLHAKSQAKAGRVDRSAPPPRSAALRHRRRAVRAIWTPSLLRRLLRHRGVRSVLCLGAVGFAFASVNAERDALLAQRAAWESTVDVVEVVRFIPAGGEVSASAVRVVERPAAVVPDGALDAIPVDALAAVDLVPGEIMLARRVRRAGEGLLPAGTVAITIKILSEPLLIEPGSLVDLWVADGANFSGRVVTRGVTVLEVSGQSLTVAVRTDDVEDVVVASLRPLVVIRR